MAERVEIEIVATDSASQVFRGITSQLGEFGNIVQSITAGRGLEELASQAVKFGQDSIKAFTEGAQAAKQLSMVSGTSIETASRFIQVLDDFGLKQEDALAATRALTKQGLEPSIATLAKLSDQYRKIQDPQQKNEFILKNLGRAGLQWAKVLDQGSDALLKHADAINQNLIFTDEMYDRAEKLRIAQDDLNDSWEAAKIRVGEQLVPALTNLLDFTNRYNAAQENQIKGWERLFPPIAMVHGAILALTGKEKENADVVTSATTAIEENSQAAQDNAEAQKAAEKAVQDATKANQDFLSGVEDLTGRLQDEKVKMADLKKQQGELILEKQKLISQGYGPESDKIKEINEKLKENQDAQDETAKAAELAGRRMILSMLQQQLAADGLNQRETAYLLQLGLKWGVYSREAVDAMKAAQNEVNDYKIAFNNIPEHKTVTITTNFVNTGFVPDLSNVVGNEYGIPSGSNTSGGGGGHHGRAAGGPVSAGEWYRVNETGTEYFRPAMGGQIIPVGRGGGGNGNITVNLAYAPSVSLADKNEVQTKILPYIIDGVRKARTDGII